MSTTLMQPFPANRGEPDDGADGAAGERPHAVDQRVQRPEDARLPDVQLLVHVDDGAAPRPGGAADHVADGRQEPRPQAQAAGVDVAVVAGAERCQVVAGRALQRSDGMDDEGAGGRDQRPRRVEDERQHTSRRPPPVDATGPGDRPVEATDDGGGRRQVDDRPRDGSERRAEDRGMRLPRRVCSAATLQQGQQAQQLEVQPDDRHHQAERGVPLEVLVQPGLRAPLDEVEVEREVERGQDRHTDAEQDAERRWARAGT